MEGRTQDGGGHRKFNREQENNPWGQPAAPHQSAMPSAHAPAFEPILGLVPVLPILYNFKSLCICHPKSKETFCLCTQNERKMHLCHH